MIADDQRTWRVGELSELTGLSVRTFHHYDQIGLLPPSARTIGGHRLYSADDVARLTVIVVLRRAGLPLAEIRDAISNQPDGVDLAALIDEQARGLETALTDTRAFGRRLAQQPLDAVAREPTRLRELISRIPQPSITIQPIVFLVYADVERAHGRLVEMFGFEPGPISRRPDGTSGYAEVSGPTANIRLHGPRPGLSPPAPEADPSSMTVVGVADLSAHFDRAVAAGAEIVKPIATLFGVHEYTAFDHEHHFWCFQEPVG
ncbi:MerR family transcriptional regulator [Microlunatus soli]|uniref:DNA-binding transcriptional regulator, MerR family n=1 Tax=Microlunatus soli TaxID=630515 RepID=A0A1H1ZWK1_9ACTN|nr:MerR family transcriptional regulator [Microlunatus soli]SDT38094.1 DNA-binding transcriptional regulator, MerR family [Microlunatus soli]